MTYEGPAYKLWNKLNSGNVGKIVVFGDSTTAGVGDEGYGGGWPPRLIQNVGIKLDVNAFIPYGSYPRQYYSTTSHPGAAAWIFAYGLSGSYASQWASWLENPDFQGSRLIRGVIADQNGIPNSGPPDLLMVCLGLNDGITGANTPAYIANINKIITLCQAMAPGVPIMVTTENPSGGDPVMDMFSGMTDDLVGQSIPLDPPLIKSNKYEDVWVLDSWQAFGPGPTYLEMYNPALTLEGLHPNLAGYIALAAFIRDWLIAGTNSSGGDPGGDPGGGGTGDHKIPDTDARAYVKLGNFLHKTEAGIYVKTSDGLKPGLPRC